MNTLSFGLNVETTKIGSSNRSVEAMVIRKGDTLTVLPIWVDNGEEYLFNDKQLNKFLRKMLSCTNRVRVGAKEFIICDYVKNGWKHILVIKT